MAEVAVLGAGAMGLAAAYHALKLGHKVTVFEADRVPGGMAAHFNFGGLSIERFYHFICKSDHATFRLCEDLGIADKLHWRETSMGYFYQGQHHGWGDPLSLLKFPHLTMRSKLRYAMQMFLATKRSRWQPLDRVSARNWLIKGSGQQAWDVLWKRLFDLKFYQHAEDISAAWVWSRVKRLGTSRKSMRQEVLGYLDGGSETLVTALVHAIETLAGSVRLAEPVQEVLTNDGVVHGVRTKRASYTIDRVIATVPTPRIPDLIPAFTEATKNLYRAIPNIGVVCVVLKLARSVTPHFWVNVVDDNMDIPGMVEFSNLRPLPCNIVYFPYYMPTSNEKFSLDDKGFVRQCVQHVRRLNPEITEQDVLASKVARLRYAQPVCRVGFHATLPPIETEICGLQVADTCFYYPEDRGISESVRLGKEMAERL